MCKECHGVVVFRSECASLWCLVVFGLKVFMIVFFFVCVCVCVFVCMSVSKIRAYVCVCADGIILFALINFQRNH